MKKPVVLFVDNEPALRYLFSEVLKEAGYVVITAEDGYEVLEHWSDWQPDLVITDKDNRMDGHELAKQLRYKGFYEPIIMHTGCDVRAHAFIRRCNEVGVNAAVQKPVRPDHLCAVVGVILQLTKISVFPSISLN